MAAVKVAPLTVQDYRLLPEAGPRYQLIEGDLLMAPAPSRFHQDVSANLQFVIQSYLEKHPTGKLYNAPFDVYFDSFNVHQPDLVFIAKNNYGILTEAGAEGAPDLIIEILSPTTSFLDKKTKRQVYARSGVEELWLVDPDLKLVHVYHLQQNAELPLVTYGEKDTFTSPHFPSLKISGKRVFRQ